MRLVSVVVLDIQMRGEQDNNILGRPALSYPRACRPSRRGWHRANQTLHHPTRATRLNLEGDLSNGTSSCKGALAGPVDVPKTRGVEPLVGKASDRRPDKCILV